MDYRILEKIGLTRNESIVYLSLLRLGTSKTGEILKKSELNSGKIYEILESLKSRGLVSESVINKVRFFTAASPVQFLEYIRKKKREIQDEEKEIKSIIPQMERIRNSTKIGAKAVTYTGLRGIKTAAEEALETLDDGDVILAMGVTSQKNEKFNKFWQHWSRKRLEKEVVAKHIFSERSDYFHVFKKMKLTEARVLDGFTPVAIDIFGDKSVLILNYEEPASCTLIHDKNTALSFIQFFNQMWKASKP